MQRLHCVSRWRHGTAGLNLCQRSFASRRRDAAGVPWRTGQRTAPVVRCPVTRFLRPAGDHPLECRSTPSTGVAPPTGRRTRRSPRPSFAACPPLCTGATCSRAIPPGIERPQTKVPLRGLRFPHFQRRLPPFRPGPDPSALRGTLVIHVVLTPSQLVTRLRGLPIQDQFGNGVQPRATFLRPRSRRPRWGNPDQRRCSVSCARPAVKSTPIRQARNGSGKLATDRPSSLRISQARTGGA
jgi:hypothetical protein